MPDYVKNKAVWYSLSSYEIRKKLFAFSLFTTITIALFQLLLGSSFITVMCLTSISVICFSFLLTRTFQVSDFLMLMFGFYCGFISLAFKTVYLQTLDMNMLAPQASSIIEFLGVCSIAIAALIAKLFTQGKSSKLSQRINEIGSMPLALPSLMLIGLGTRYLFVLTARGGENGPDIIGSGGIYAIFHPILLLSIIFLFQSIKEKHPHARILGGVMFAGILYMAIIANAKKELFTLMLAALLAITFLEIRLKPWKLISLTLIAYLLVSFVAPAMQIARKQLHDVSINERLIVTWGVLSSSNFSSRQLETASTLAFNGFKFSSGEFNNYIHPQTKNIDRFVHVFTTDQIVRNDGMVPRIGLAPALKELGDLVLPSFLTQKDASSIGDKVAWVHGIRKDGNIARPVLGIVGSAYAISGVGGAIFLCFISTFIFFCCANYLFGRIDQRSIFGLVGCVYLANYPERPFVNFISVAMRDFIIIWLLMTCMIFACKTISNVHISLPWKAKVQ